MKNSNFDYFISKNVNGQSVIMSDPENIKEFRKKLENIPFIEALEAHRRLLEKEESFSDFGGSVTYKIVKL